MEADAAAIRDRILVNTMTHLSNAGLTEIEQRIVDFLIAREDKLRGDMVAQQGVERERLVSAMLENYWLRRAVESGEMLGEADR